MRLAENGAAQKLGGGKAGQLARMLIGAKDPTIPVDLDNSGSNMFIIRDRPRREDVKISFGSLLDIHGLFRLPTLFSINFTMPAGTKGFAVALIFRSPPMPSMQALGMRPQPKQYKKEGPWIVWICQSTSWKRWNDDGLKSSRRRLPP